MSGLLFPEDGIDAVRRDLDALVGSRYYIIENRRDGADDITVLVFKRFTLDGNGKPVCTEYPDGYAAFLEAALKRNHRAGITVQIAPFIPNDRIDAHIRREQLKIILVASLLGVFSLFFGVILYRALGREIARRRKIF